MHFKKIVLLILDGFGIATRSNGNAISLANPENLNYLLSNYPALTLQASGPLVGLPWGERGNSEVGHLNIGSGRAVYQDLPRITKSIQSGEFFKNPAFLRAVEHVKQYDSQLHLLGMVSPGGVHSYDEHLYALLGLAKEQGLQKVFVHMITDGRDTGERVALTSLSTLNEKIEKIGVGAIADITGRFYAMDRGGHWDQTMLTYDALVKGTGETARSAEECIAMNYAKGIYDEMIRPTVITKDGKPIGKIAYNDAVIFFNFRQDRAIQLTEAFVSPERLPEPYQRPKLENLYFVTMTSYMEKLQVDVAYGPIEVKNVLAEVVSKAGMKQFHEAESEKFAHVTSFFNGGNLDPLPGEDRLIVSSPDNTNNYIDYPEMSILRLTETLISKLGGDTSFFVVNFANSDMVGHTGNLDSAILAVKAIDLQLARIAEAVLKEDACLIVTADHGNCEQMFNLMSGQIDKDHSTSPVPLLVVAKELKRPKPQQFNYENLAGLMPEGALSDIAPTILEMYGLPKPEEMTGISLMPKIMEQVEGRVV